MTALKMSTITLLKNLAVNSCFSCCKKEPHEVMAPGRSDGGNVQEVQSAVWGKPPGVDGSNWWLP